MPLKLRTRRTNWKTRKRRKVSRPFVSWMIMECQTSEEDKSKAKEAKEKKTFPLVSRVSSMIKNEVPALFIIVCNIQQLFSPLLADPEKENSNTKRDKRESFEGIFIEFRKSSLLASKTVQKVPLGGIFFSSTLCSAKHEHPRWWKFAQHQLRC